MATQVLELDEVYRTLAARLLDRAAEYRVAPWAGEMFAVTESGAVTPYSHDTYTIELERSTWPDGIRVAARDGRAAIETHTECTIRWLDGLTLDDPEDSYREALRHEYRVIQALKRPAAVEADGTATGRSLRIRVHECSRQVTEHVWLVHALRLTIDHTMTLEGA